VTERQHLAVQLKARGLKDVEIAKRLQVSTETLRRWWRDPEVQKALKEAQAKVTERLDDSLLSFDQKLASAANEGLDRITYWTQQAYNKAAEAEDSTEATRWLAVAFRGEALLMSAYLRRFAKAETSDATMKSIVEAALQAMMSGDIDDLETELDNAEDLEMEEGHHQVRRRSPVGARPEDGETSTVETV
jgi:transposase